MPNTLCPTCEGPPHAIVCAVCGRCAACCAHPVCDHCDTPTAALCAHCEFCPTCCDCGRCDACERPRERERLCAACDACEDCCECEHCQRCNGPCSSPCSRCAHCEDCCRCLPCDACDEPAPPNSLCSRCDACEDCCTCVTCDRCDERVGEGACCSDCEVCDECCSCHDAVLPYETDVLGTLAFQGQPEGGLYLGVELEVEADSRRAFDRQADAWSDAGAGWLVLKNDCSLQRGFEIVTAPADLATHAKQWTRFLGDETYTHGLARQAPRCGMHVHVSRAPISPLTLGKILVFMNSPQTRQPIVTLAGRLSEQYAPFTPKKVTHGAVVSPDKKSWQPIYGTWRREAVNVCNPDTLEFRLFQSTLSLTHVLANLQFVDAVVRWCAQASLRDIESWASFWAYVAQQAKPYRHLLAYLTPKLTAAPHAA